MKTRTLYFAPGRAAPGMTLAKAIADREGHVLLAAGTVLDTDMLERLIRRNIEAIAVLVLDTRDAETIANELSVAQERVHRIFRGPGNPAREALHTATLNFRLEATK